MLFHVHRVTSSVPGMRTVQDHLLFARLFNFSQSSPAIKNKLNTLSNIKKTCLQYFNLLIDEKF
jgi:hypothetical protein